MKIKITNINHPIEECIPDLSKLVEDIEERQQLIYNTPYLEIDDISFSLSTTPEDDINSFNEKYSYIQSHCNRVSDIFIQIKKELRIWSSYKNRLKILYRKARNLLLTTKPEIKALKNKELQEAAVQTSLETLVDLMDGLDIVIEELEYDADIVSIKMANLDKANVNLNRQQKVVEDMIGLNGPVGVRGRIVARIKNE